MKKVAILQSNYIPWKGYFDMINAVDEFVLYDEAQFTRRDWRNRNRIKTKDGVSWLTIPVEVKGKFTQSVAETKIADPSWAKQHWETIRHNYAKAPHFRDYEALFEELYGRTYEKLSEVNEVFLRAIGERLGIKTKISRTRDYDYDREAGPTQKLVQICRAAGASLYVSGPAAKAYMDETLFRKAGIQVGFADYSGYPEYPQPHEPFAHDVSVVDLLFCEGSKAPDFMKTFRKETGFIVLSE